MRIGMQSKQKLNSLQVYRGLASILVVLHHSNLILAQEFNQDTSFNLFHFGWAGVDFFFVLSGFIIFYIHQSDLGKPDQFNSFAKKRLVRIYPLYWIILVGKILISLLGDKNNRIYESNFFQFFKAFSLGLQDKADLDIFLGVSWTLTYEIFFYAIFALAILLPSKIYWPILISWIIGILLNLFNLLPIAGFRALEFTLDAHNLEFILGIIAAYTISKYQVNYSKILLCTALTMVIISIANTRYHEFNTAGIPSALAYGIPFSLLIIASVQIEKNTALRMPSFLLYLGNASYSIYLTHGFLINNITKICTKIAEKFHKEALLSSPHSFSHFLFISLIVITSMLIGCIIYNYIEKPLLTMLKDKQLPPAT
jgi:exopolysaccharide production protein ExoZ